MREVTIPVCAMQREFLDAILYDDAIDAVGFGGSRGTTKTFVSCLAMVLRSLQHPGTRGLMLRKTEGAAVRNLRDAIKKVCRLLDVPAKWIAGEKVFRFANGSEIELAFCRKEDDYEKYQGVEYRDITFEEGTQHSEMAWLLVGGSNRSGIEGVKGKRWLTANPGGVGHGWVKRLFVNPETREEGYKWIGGTLKDALPHLEIDPGYARRVLHGLPDWKKKQWKDGDWDALAGLYFEVPPHLICEVSVPLYARWFCGVDWGFWPDPFAVLWMARWTDEQGRDHVHVAFEFSAHKLDPDVQAKRALAVESKAFDAGWLNQAVRTRYADAQVWSRSKEKTSTEIGKTIAGLWRAEKFFVQKPVSMARVPGWTLIRMLLSHVVLTISPRCVGLLAEMQEAVQEGSPGAATGEDIDEACADHLLTCLRLPLLSIYGLNYRPPEADPYAEQKKPLSERYNLRKRARKSGRA